MDLRCWMALATRALATIGSNLGLPPRGGQAPSAGWGAGSRAAACVPAHAQLGRDLRTQRAGRAQHGHGLCPYAGAALFSCACQLTLGHAACRGAAPPGGCGVPGGL